MCKKLTTIVISLFIIVSLSSNVYSQEIKENNSGQDYYELGVDAQNNANYAHALEYFESSIKQNPHNIEAYNRLGVTYRALNEYDKAIEVYEKSLKISPKNYEAYHLLSIAYLYKNMYPKSLEYAEKYLKLKPDDPESYFGLANIYSAMEDYELARINYNKALELYNSDQGVEKSDAYTDIALSYYQESDYRRAINAFSSAIEYNHKNAVAFYYMGLSYYSSFPKNLKLARQNVVMAKNLGYEVPDYVLQNLEFKDIEK